MEPRESLYGFALIVTGAMPKSDKNYFYTLIKDFGGKISDQDTSFIKIYIEKSAVEQLQKFFEDCAKGKWGKQLKNVIDTYKLHGPYELRNDL
jgi:hypothetical protein